MTDLKPADDRRIARITVERMDIPLLSPFGISGGSQAVAQNVLVSVWLADGTVGIGEGAPLPAYNGETQEGVLRELQGAVESTPGQDATRWAEIGAKSGCGGSARCALEMAILDAWARCVGRPLWKVFGGAGTEIETDMTVTTGTAEAARTAAADIRRRGIRTIKVKVGGGAPQDDLARIDAILEAAPGAPLILDGNAGLSRADATALAAGIRKRGVQPALLEQWLAKKDLAGMRALRKETGWTVAADESVVTVADAEKVIRERAADVINIKLMKAGIAEALKVAAAAKAAGIGLMIGGNLESILAMTTSACFAAGQGGFAFADLDTPLFLAENPFVGGYAQQGAVLSVAHIAAGHGVIPAS